MELSEASAAMPASGLGAGTGSRHTVPLYRGVRDVRGRARDAPRGGDSRAGGRGLEAAPVLLGTPRSLLRAWPSRTSLLLPAAGEGRGRRRGSCCPIQL